MWCGCVWGGAVLLVVGPIARADDDKAQVLVAGSAPVPAQVSEAAGVGGGGYRFAATHDTVRVPVVIVGGTPHQMGWHLGRLMREEIQRFVPAALAGFKAKLQLTDEVLDGVWATTAAYTDDRFEQELVGLAEGAGLPVRTLQHVHCLPLLMPYSCSSIAAWGSATEDGHLYQTRNLDWTLEAGAHEFPVLTVYLPAEGNAHVLPTFAGVIGANCGLSAAGIALSEMGDSPQREAPYNLHAPHFTTWFRTLLYDAVSLSDALTRFHQIPATKRYHFVFGDGRAEKRAVKILAHSVEAPPANLRIWRDNDPADELAPNVLPCLVYQDEGRGAFPALEAQHGRLNAERLLAVANQIPIRGGNVLNAVFDATALRLWAAYAGEGKEAYQRPAVFLDLARLDGDGDGLPDLAEGGRDRDGNGRPDFLDAAR
jgi:isopenicillin-N N-acyltransferase like protein